MILSYKYRILHILHQICKIFYNFQALAVPSVAFEPRFRGSFRNLMYLQTRSGATSPEKQEMMAYKVNMGELGRNS